MTGVLFFAGGWLVGMTATCAVLVYLERKRREWPR